MSPNIAIIGGGIGGLSTAYYLLRRAALQGLKLGNVYVLEKQNRFGGWLQTKRFNQDDYFELGPRTIALNSVNGVNALVLANELQLDERIFSIPQSSKAFKSRYLAIDGSLKSLSFGAKDFVLSNKPFKPLVSYAYKDLITKPIALSDTEDITVDEFFRRRFGPEIAEYMAGALCRGISGGDARTLSMRAMFPALYDKQAAHGSVIKGLLKDKEDIYAQYRSNPLVQRCIHEKWAVFTFDRGIQTLPETLVDNLSLEDNVQLRPSTEVVNINSIDSGTKSQIEIVRNGRDRETLEVDHIFSSVLASQLARMLPGSKEDLQSKLTTIPSAHMGVVGLAFNRPHLPIDHGFGFLVPPRESSEILGVTFDSCILSRPGKTILTVMMGGHCFLDLFGPPDRVDHDRLLDVSLKAIGKYLNINDKPDVHHVAVHQDCIPQYTLGHRVRVGEIEKMVEGSNLSLVGTSFRGFSVPDVIANARTQVDAWINSRQRDVKGKIVRII